MSMTTCRWCGGKLTVILSLGKMPIVNYFPSREGTNKEKRYPLTFCVCRRCGLAQLGQVIAPEKIFGRYHYLTGASGPLVHELESFAKESIRRYRLKKGARVLDIGSNDGTLLKAFQILGMSGLGIEPASAIARGAISRGIPTINAFFTSTQAKKIRKKYGQFDLVTATHVLANIVDLHDFFSGIGEVLSPRGIFILEVGSLADLIKKSQFDSIYHEHYSYFSSAVLQKILRSVGMTIFGVTHQSAQGGSLRIAASRSDNRRGNNLQGKREGEISKKEYAQFAKHVREIRRRVREIIRRDLKGKVVVGFGAPAKGVTLLNYCGLDQTDIAFVVDSTPEKQGKFVPGTRIPVFAEAYLIGKRVDAILVLSWNYREEIFKKIKQLVRHPVTVIMPFPKLVLTLLR